MSATNKKPTLRIYYEGLSQPSRAVVYLVKMANIPCELVLTSIMQQQHRSKDFVKMNPNKKVPAMKDVHNGKEITLFESGAMMRYICNKYLPADNQFYPRGDPVKKARVEEMLAFHHKVIRPGARAFFSKVLGPLTGMGDKLNPLEEKLRSTEIAQEAERLYRDEEGVLGNGVTTIADLLILTEVSQFPHGDVDLEPFPFVSRRIQALFDVEELREFNTETLWMSFKLMKNKIPLLWMKYLPEIEDDEEEEEEEEVEGEGEEEE